MKNLKKILFASSVLVFSTASFAEIITFQNGQEKNDSLVSIDGGDVFLKNAGRVNRDEISMIRFSQSNVAKISSETNPSVSPEMSSEAKKLFSEAEAFKAKYPDAQGLIINDIGTNDYNADGTTKSKYRTTVLIMKEEAKRAYGTVVNYETKGRSTARIVSATVYCPDGKIYPFDPSKIQRSEPQSAEKFFSAGGQYLLYQLPGLEVGCIADFTTEEELYNPYKKDFFFPSWSFQGEYPVLRSEISISVPEETPFVYSAHNFKGDYSKLAAPSISTKDGRKIYKWRVENIPPVIEESNMPPLGDLTMNMVGSVLTNWDPIFDWTNKLYKERTQANDKLKAFTLDLIKDCKTDEEKAVKIYHYIQKEIRYIAIKVGIGSGIGGYDANLTWERKWGCCVDKALLLSAMMNVAGIKNSPILINTNNEPIFDTKVPGLYFDHAISVIYLNGKKIFLDSTNYDYRYPEIADFDFGVNVLNIFNRSIDFIPLPLPSENAGYYDNVITVSSDGGISVSENMKYTGSKEAALRGFYRRIKETERRQVFENMVKKISPKAVLRDFKIENTDDLEKPFSMWRKYDAPDYLQKAGDIMIFTIPDFELPTQVLSEVSLNKRKYPIQFMVNNSAYNSYDITLPPGSELISMPEKIKLSNKNVDFTTGCEKKGANKISCFMNLEKKSRIIPPQDYADYKSLLEKAANYTKKSVYFRIVNGKQKAD
jgi:transglutaminase-like putative cysteine protease